MKVWDIMSQNQFCIHIFHSDYQPIIPTLFLKT